MSKEPTRPPAGSRKPAPPPAPPKRRNPALPPPLEGAFQRAVVDFAKLAGWKVYWTHNSKHSPAGWPDLVLTLKASPFGAGDHLGRVLFRELKRDRRPSRVTDDQRECLETLKAAGLDAKVWCPEDWPEIEQTLTAHRRR